MKKLLMVTLLAIFAVSPALAQRSHYVTYPGVAATADSDIRMMSSREQLLQSY